MRKDAMGKEPIRIWRDSEEPLPGWRCFLAEVLDLWSPSDTPRVRWAGGVLVPILLAGIGQLYVRGNPLHLYGRDGRFIPGGPLVLTGGTAVAAGVFLLAAALFIHFQCFWPDRNEWVCAIGKLVAMLLAVGSVIRFAGGMFALLA